MAKTSPPVDAHTPPVPGEHENFRLRHLLVQVDPFDHVGLIRAIDQRLPEVWLMPMARISVSVRQR